MLVLLGVGSRSFTARDRVHEFFDYIQSTYPGDVAVISGGAAGADRMVAAEAKERDLSLKVVLPDWRRFGKSAGYRRNEDMVALLRRCRTRGHDIGCIAFLDESDGPSKGTRSTIDLCTKANVDGYIIRQPQASSHALWTLLAVFAGWTTYNNGLMPTPDQVRAWSTDNGVTQ